MLQHKQEERKLKRIEGDIVKKQRLLRRVMHDYDNGMCSELQIVWFLTSFHAMPSPQWQYGQC